MSETARAGGPKIVFTHVPKTAGSTIGARLHHLLGGQRLAVVPTDDDDLSQIIPRLQSIDAISGHVRFPIIRPYAPNACYFGAVRDPIDRIVSHYFFVIRHKGIDPRIYELGLRKGFNEFYESVIKNSGRINLQSRFYADSSLAKDAIEVIRSFYSLVWDSEQTTKAWACMKEIASEVLQIDDPHTTPEINGYVAPRSAHGDTDGSRPESYRDFLGPVAVEVILRENAEDLKLFQWVQARGGIVTRP